MSAPIVQLGDLVWAHYGKALKQEDRDAKGSAVVYGSSGEVGWHRDSLTQEATIVVGRKGSVGAVTFAPNGGWVIDTAYFLERKNPDGLDLRYLFHALRNADLAKDTITTSIPGLNRDDLLANAVRVPCIDEQRHVAAILDKADSLRRKRQDAIRLADEFLRAVFVDMFGDPAVNSKRLSTKRIEELCQVATGATPSRDRSDFFGGPHPWVKTGEVDCPMILSADEYITDSAIRETNCKLFPIRTLLVAMYGQGKTRGKVGMLGIPAATNQACAAILPSASISPFFLYAQLGLMYEHLRAMGRGGNQENLNLGMIKSLEVLVPPKVDVERYLSIRKRSDAMLTKARLAQEDAALLTSSLTSSLLG